MARFIAEQEKAALVSDRASRPVGQLDRGAHGETPDRGLAARSTGAAAAAGRAVGLVAGSVRLQAYTLAFIDAFHLMAWMSVAMLILIATLGRFPLNFRDLAALDAGARPAAHRRPVMTVRASIFALLFSAGTCAAFAQQPEPRGGPAHHASRSRRPGAGAQPCGPPRAVVGRREGPREGRGQERLLSPGAKRDDAGPPDGYTAGRNSRRRARRRRCDAGSAADADSQSGWRELRRPTEPASFNR